MIKYDKMTLILILFLVLCWTGPGHAARYSQIYEFSVPTLEIMEDGTLYPAVRECRPKVSPVGAPMLPRMISKLYIPAGERVESVTVDYSPAVTMPGNYDVKAISRQIPLSMADKAGKAVRDETIYSSDSFYPGVTHVNLGTQILKGARLSMVQLCPVQYNPAMGRIRYYTSMKVTVTTGASRSLSGSMFRNLLSDNEAIMAAVDNGETFLKESPRALRKSTRAGGDRQYLIITTAALKSTMQKLADHRASAAGGSLNTHVALVDDIERYFAGQDLAQKIRYYVRESYLNHGTEYVVLGGDAHGEPGSQTVPTRACVATVSDSLDENIPCDLYFGCLDGPWDGNNNGLWGEPDDGTGGGDIDWHSEVYVGRINADSPDRAMAQIDKIIAYETTIPAYGALMAGEALLQDPLTYGADKLDWLAEFMPEIPIDTLYDRDQQDKDWNSQQLIEKINSNHIVWINHLGHSNVTNNMKLTEDFIQYINNFRYYFIYTQGCYPGAMDNRSTRSWDYGYEDSIIENMVMARDSGPFAAVANSRFGWFMPGPIHDSGSNLLHAYFIQQIAMGVDSLGKANQISKEKLDMTDSVNRWIAFETNLFGDPVSRLPSPGISTYELISWPQRGNDLNYCIDICDENWNIYPGLQAVACGEGLHSWSPKSFVNDLGIEDSQMSGLKFKWRVWSPGGYGGEGFEGSVTCP